MDWRPSASIENLRKRAIIMQSMRAFFEKRAYLEVETPILSHYGVTDLQLLPLKTNCFKKTCYLHTSPEYAMKRLLAAGSGSIFQFAKVFRDEEKGRWHNPEFTLLEWYKLGACHHELMAEVDIFLQEIIKTKPIVKRSYEEVFQTYCNLNPHTATLQELKKSLSYYNLDNVLEDQDDKDTHLYLLMSHVVEPNLAQQPFPTAVYDFPVTQAALARIINGCAARFEIYYRGVELLNGFYELNDKEEQAQRFQAEQAKRILKCLDVSVVDELFLAALEYGLPQCSGVAVGVDRLIALALSQDSLKKVMAFTFENV